MTCSVKFVRLNEIYMCTEFYMNTCKHVWAIHQVFKLCSRGRRRAPVPRPGPSLCGVRTPTDSNVCANFQEFLSMLRPPKVPGWLNKKKKKKKKKIIILWKSIGPCALLAWALIIIIIIIIIINKADSIGSSHHRCSVPNNKQSRFNRVLTPSVLGP